MMKTKGGIPVESVKIGDSGKLYLGYVPYVKENSKLIMKLRFLLHWDLNGKCIKYDSRVEYLVKTEPDALDLVFLDVQTSGRHTIKTLEINPVQDILFGVVEIWEGLTLNLSWQFDGILTEKSQKEYEAIYPRPITDDGANICGIFLDQFLLENDANPS